MLPLAAMHVRLCLCTCQCQAPSERSWRGWPWSTVRLSWESEQTASPRGPPDLAAFPPCGPHPLGPWPPSSSLPGHTLLASACPSVGSLTMTSPFGSWWKLHSQLSDEKPSRAGAHTAVEAQASSQGQAAAGIHPAWHLGFAAGRHATFMAMGRGSSQGFLIHIRDFTLSLRAEPWGMRSRCQPDVPKTANSALAAALPHPPSPPPPPSPTSTSQHLPSPPLSLHTLV